MKLLLDESLPRQLKRELPNHEVSTAPEMGWAGIANGQLLQLASAEFDAFITADQNLEHQQNLSRIDIPILVLIARSTRLEDLKPLIPNLLKALERIQPGEVIRITS